VALHGGIIAAHRRADGRGATQARPSAGQVRLISMQRLSPE